MQLIKISYEEKSGSDGLWRLCPLTFDRINLIVGRNSSGKTRTINLINTIAQQLSGRNKTIPQGGSYEIDFVHESEEWNYKINFSDNKVISEILSHKNEILLERGTGGVGRILTATVGQHLPFQTPDNQIAVVSRQDNIQHAFLDHIISWAQGVYYYPFGTLLGQHHLAVFVEGAAEVDPYDFNQATALLRSGIKKFGEAYKSEIIKDMAALGYRLLDIGVQTSEVIRFEGSLQQPSSIYVREEGIPTAIEGINLSQGMFRALSTIIQLNYGLYSQKPELILIDDIGEGLDYGRSCALIELIISKVQKSNLQIIATTNDRFVMNSVDLSYWTVLDREGSIVKSINHRTNPSAFDDFRFTGLNNFDFFSGEYFRGESHK